MYNGRSGKPPATGARPSQQDEDPKGVESKAEHVLAPLSASEVGSGRGAPRDAIGIANLAEAYPRLSDHPQDFGIVSVREAAQNQGDVLAAEPKTIREGDFDIVTSCHVRDVVEVAVRTGWSRLMVGGTIPSRIVSRQTIASTLPAAAIRWPIMLLVLEIGTL